MAAATTFHARPPLATALHHLARQFQDASGIAVVMDVTGQAVELADHVEDGLYRIADCLLAAAWRHGRCSLVRLELLFGEQEVGLRARDDGVGLAHRHADLFGDSFHRIRRTVESVGGRMRLGAGLPHGLRLEVWVPRGAT